MEPLMNRLSLLQEWSDNSGNSVSLFGSEVNAFPKVHKVTAVFLIGELGVVEILVHVAFAQRSAFVTGARRFISGIALWFLVLFAFLHAGLARTRFQIRAQNRSVECVAGFQLSMFTDFLGYSSRVFPNRLCDGGFGAAAFNSSLYDFPLLQAQMGTVVSLHNLSLLRRCVSDYEVWSFLLQSASGFHCMPKLQSLPLTLELTFSIHPRAQ